MKSSNDTTDMLERERLELEEKSEKNRERLAKLKQASDLARLRRDVERDEIIADLAEKYGLPAPDGTDMAVLCSGAEMIIVGRVEDGEYNAFQKLVEKSDSKKNPLSTAAIERFVRKGLLHPSQDEFSRLATKMHLLVLHASNEILKLHGANIEEREGKA